MKRLVLVLITLCFPFSGFADGGTSEVTDLPERIHELVDNEQYQEALSELTSFVAKEKENADAWNLLGYSQRKTGSVDQSLKSYKRALRLEPRHLGAHEYIGELYLMMGKPQKAQKHLDRLRKYCGDCEEAEELAEAIEKYADS